mgnify:CR=1 FL=1
MGAEFVHSVIVEEQDPAADAILEHELPVNPLSGLLLHLKPLNETGTFTTYDPLSLFLDALNSIDIIWRGITLFSASGRDARNLLLHRWHRDVIQNGLVNTDATRRSIVLPIMFGRWWGDREEGLPQTRSGELKIRLDVDVTSAGYEDLRYGIEALELPGVTFKAFTRCTTISQTFAATGFNDIDLPIGHAIRGLLCFQTTAFAGATPTPGLGRLELLVDGKQQGYSSTDAEVARGIAAAVGMPPARFQEHVHFADLDAAADADTEPEEQIETLLDNYVYLDFDFTRDDVYNLDTSKARRIVLRSNAEVAEAMRVVVLEKMEATLIK